MNNLAYYEALNNRELSKLEELARRAGYVYPFKPLDAPVMKTRSLRYMESVDENAVIELGSAHRYFREQEVVEENWHPLRQMFSITLPSLNWIHDRSPREDWNSKYKDYFTLVKNADGKIYFVDCYQPLQRDRTGNRIDDIVLMKGSIRIRGLQPIQIQDIKDLESEILIDIAYKREKYPPIPWYINLSGPNYEWTGVRTLLAGFSFLFLGLSLRAGHIEQWPLIAGATTLVFESIIQWHLYQTLGQGSFRHIEIGRKAIDALVLEAEKCKS